MSTNRPPLDFVGVTPFVDQALGTLHQETPVVLRYLYRSSAPAGPPRTLTPAFFGSFDWHSSVHSHWLLVRALRLFPDAPFAERVVHAVAQSITPENIAQEVSFREDQRHFELPYGIAWLFLLDAEIAYLERPGTEAWLPTIAPLVSLARQHWCDWLAATDLPIRTGEHNQTAFACGMVIDAAVAQGDGELAESVRDRCRHYYTNDRHAPLAYEPSAFDFLSPSLAEADVMRRSLEPSAYSTWLDGFIPELAEPKHLGPSLYPALSSPDPADGKLSHRDGLGLSRAWMAEAIARALPAGDPRRESLESIANRNAAAALPRAVTPHYAGSHWLGSFALVLLTGGSAIVAR